MTDHYRLLQVRRDASPEVIAAAYRSLMKDAHPDRGGHAERARRLNAAYEMLIDPEARAAYDRTLPADTDPHSRPLAPEMAFRLGRSIGRWLRSAR